MRGPAFLSSLFLALAVQAADAARPERKEVFGDVTVHYSAFASSMLQPQVATDNGLIRSTNLGVLNITVLKRGGPEAATVSGTVEDLTGRGSPLAFRQMTDHGTIYYLAQFKIEQPETLVFDLKIETGGVSHKLSFNQEVFSDE